MNVAPLDDPGSLSTDPVKRTTALKQVNAYVEANLRQASWSEVGVDIFFVGVNGVVALFCAFLYYFGAVPPLTACASLSLTWIAPIFLLNWLVCWVGYSGYDWMFNRYADLFGARPTKFNPAPYEPGQLRREMFYTMLSMGFASAWEVLVLHLWATGRSGRVYEGWADAPLWQFLGTFLALGLWSDFHFYWVHRLLHTSAFYNPFGIPVHKLHHMSNNPGPWSGMSMHPVESIVYLSKIAGVLFVPAHPLHLLFMLFNATLMPIPGHSGHLEALGNEYHWIHHHCFSYNYGSPSVPLDKLFGTHYQFKKAEKAA